MKNITSNATTTDAGKRVVFGVVSQFNPRRDFGLVLLDGCNRSFSISMRSARTIEASDAGVQFSEKPLKVIPALHDTVVAELAGVNGETKLLWWSFHREWQAAKKTEANLKKTRGVRSYQFMRRFTLAVRNNVTQAVNVAMPRRVSEKPFGTIMFSNSCRA